MRQPASVAAPAVCSEAGPFSIVVQAARQVDPAARPAAAMDSAPVAAMQAPVAQVAPVRGLVERPALAARCIPHARALPRAAPVDAPVVLAAPAVDPDSAPPVQAASVLVLELESVAPPAARRPWAKRRVRRARPVQEAAAGSNIRRARKAR